MSKKRAEERIARYTVKSVKATIISAVATVFIAVVTAEAFIFAVYEYVTISRQKRAYITMANPILRKISSSKAEIHIKFVNVGKNPAERFDGYVKVFPAEKQNPKIVTFNFDLLADLPPGMEIVWRRELKIPANIGQHYIYCHLEYIDSITGKPYKKPFNCYWKGIQDGKVIDERVFLGTDEHKAKIKKVLKLN